MSGVCIAQESTVSHTAAYACVSDMYTRLTCSACTALKNPPQHAAANGRAARGLGRRKLQNAASPAGCYTGHGGHSGEGNGWENFGREIQHVLAYSLAATMPSSMRVSLNTG